MGRKEHKYHYIYKITCLKNNRYYIGMHSTNNLEDGYFGGGKRIKNSVKKHGKDAHRKEILEFYKTRKEVVEREKCLVSEELLKDSLCMNLALGGMGGFRGDILNNLWNSDLQKEFSKRGKESLAKLKKENPSWYNNMIEKRSKSMKDRIKSDGYTHYKWPKGEKHKEETKTKISEKAKLRIGEKNSQFGTCWINKEQEYKKIKKEFINDFLSNGWNLGRKSYKNKK